MVSEQFWNDFDPRLWLLRQLETEFGITAFGTFSQLPKFSNLVLQDDCAGTKGPTKIDPHFYNKLREHSGTGRPLTLVLPAQVDPSITWDTYVGGCENGLDWPLLRLLARNGNGVIVDCRGSPGSGAKRLERNTFSLKPEDLPANWQRHFLCWGGMNSLTKKTWSRNLQDWVEDFSPVAFKAFQQLFALLKEVKPSVVIWHCRVGQARGPTGVAAFLVAVCRGIPASANVGQSVERYLQKTRKLVDMSTTIEAHFKRRGGHQEGVPHMTGATFVERGVYKLREAAAEVGLGSESLRFPEICDHAAFTIRAIEILCSDTTLQLDLPTEDREPPADQRHIGFRKQAKDVGSHEDGRWVDPQTFRPNPVVQDLEARRKRQEALRKAADTAQATEEGGTPFGGQKARPRPRPKGSVVSGMAREGIKRLRKEKGTKVMRCRNKEGDQSANREASASAAGANEASASEGDQRTKASLAAKLLMESEKSSYCGPPPAEIWASVPGRALQAVLGVAPEQRERLEAQPSKADALDVTPEQREILESTTKDEVSEVSEDEDKPCLTEDAYGGIAKVESSDDEEAGPGNPAWQRGAKRLLRQGDSDDDEDAYSDPEDNDLLLPVVKKVRFCGQEMEGACIFVRDEL